MNITGENCVHDADVRDWSMGGAIYYKLPVFFEGNANANAMALLTNNWNTTNMNEKRHDDVNVVWMNKRTSGFDKTNNESNDSQQSNVNNQYENEIQLLKVFLSNITNERELQSKLEEFNGNVLSVITYLVSKRRLSQENNEAKEDLKSQNELEQVSFSHTQIKTLFDVKDKETQDVKVDKIEKEEEKIQIGELKSGINLGGLCSKSECLAAQAKSTVWINIGLSEGLIVSSMDCGNKTFPCPNCKSTVKHISYVRFLNSEFFIRIIDGNNKNDENDNLIAKGNQCKATYLIKPGYSYELQATEIKQHTNVLEELRSRSEKAMNSDEMKQLINKLEQDGIKVVKPDTLKGDDRINEKSTKDYGGNYNRMFDIGRFTILCENKNKLDTAVKVLQKADTFGMTVSEDKDFFNYQSNTHHRFHNIKLFVPKHDVYIEMQATLEGFTTLKDHSVIENPKLSHLYYEIIRAWDTKDTKYKELKEASDETLTKINDIICEWMTENNIVRMADRYRIRLNEGIIKPPQLSGKTEEDIKNNIPLKLAQFTYDQLSNFKPNKPKGKAIYIALFDYYKTCIIGEDKLANYSDIPTILQEARIKEIEKEDAIILQALETYIPLRATNEPRLEKDDKEDFDCHEHVIEFIEKKSDTNQVMIIQGKSGSGKSLYGRYLEENLWKRFNDQINTSQQRQQFIPVFISLSNFYHKNDRKKNIDNDITIDESQLILQALQSKSKYIHDDIRGKFRFVFILDGFDEVFRLYNENSGNLTKYFYDRFKLNEWDAKVILTCRSDVLSEENIKKMLIGDNNNTSKLYLLPFSTSQIDKYIEKFVNMQQKTRDESKTNKNKDNWTIQQYRETLNKYSSLYKMVQEPFLLRLVLTVLPSLSKNDNVGTNISKAQVYDIFLNQWIDEHVQDISQKLNELKMITNKEELKHSFQMYCEDLAFDMFLQNEQIVTDNERIPNNSTLPYSNIDPITDIDFSTHNMEQENKSNEETKYNEITKIIETTQQKDKKDVWKKYFKADNINKFVLRRINANQYTFLHKSCQEYYAAQKIIFDIISWKSTSNINQQFQQQFEIHAQQFLINRKLLNEEMGIIQFIADRIYDINPIFANLKSKLFQLIQSSKNNSNISIAAANAATILNIARVSMSHQNWDKVNISHAILDYAFLEGTNYVGFYKACLRNTNFTKASVHQVNFGQYGYLKNLSDVTSVQFSPDGNRIVSGSWDGTIRLWDASTGKLIQSYETIQPWSGSSDLSCEKIIQLWHLREQLGGVYSVQFSPNGKIIVSGSGDKIIRLWDTSSKKLIQSLEGHSKDVTSVQFSPNGSRIVSGSLDNTIRLWDVSSGKLIQSLEGHSKGVRSVQFSPDGNKIVSGSLDNTIRLWDASSGELIQSLKGHLGFVRSVQFSPDGSRVVSGSDDKTIRLWDASSGKIIQSLEGHLDFVWSVQFSPDGKRIASGSKDKTIRLWDASSGKIIQSLEGHLGDVISVQFSSDGNRIVSGSEDKTIRLWDASRKLIQSLEDHLKGVTSVQFSPNGNRVVSGSDDKTIRLWDTLLGKQIQSLEGHSDSVKSVQFSPDGNRIVSGKLIRSLEGHSKCVTSVQFSPDGNRIVSGSSDETIRLWDASSGKLIQSLEGHSDSVTSVQFSPDGNKIVSGSSDGIIRLWDALSGKLIQFFEGILDDISSVLTSPNESKIVFDSYYNAIRSSDASLKEIIRCYRGCSGAVSSVQFSPDGNRIVSGSDDNTIRLWDVSSGKLIQSFKGHPGFVRSVQFSLDGNRILSGSDDKIIRLWDVPSGKLIQSLKGHLDCVWSVQFSPNGNRVVSGSEDKTIRLWNASSGKLIQSFEDYSDAVSSVHFPPDGNKIVADKLENLSSSNLIHFSDDKKSMLCLQKERISLWKCIWQGGVQSSLSLEGSIWKDTNLTPLQLSLVEEYGGIF
ncbi:NB-ARC domain-containing protein [Reticulomyxa filosa]|uniref:NB-ARC domain-containing protein n=1 Tax=Reticulomyxa filosa TaxID=46433 RepID=X6MBI8_RETFI|nr:NB-ARC domain-containing protein [Reticulomyxa filosa]|eukprot:ETO10827.1 NB-ARC domain-containing protein [Reticulomyxa filosa]